MVNNEIKTIVRKNYAKIARQESNCCCGPKSSCCDDKNTNYSVSRNIGYSDDEMKSVPEGANLGLGCGNPVALASLKPGEIVLDLGSGAGFDSFLAAKKVGPNGRIIGVDMTPEMLANARQNAKKGNYNNVEFRLGEIEHVPVADSSVDVIISNCVINLSPDKDSVFREAFRVLKTGGRLMISDIVLTAELPDLIKNSIEAYVGCLAGALLKNDYLKKIDAAGFQKIEVIDETYFPLNIIMNDPADQIVSKFPELTIENVHEISKKVLSVRVSAIK